MELSPQQVTELSAAIGAKDFAEPTALVKAVADYATMLRDDNAKFIKERDTAAVELSTAQAKIVELSAVKPGPVLELSAASKTHLGDRVNLAQLKIGRLVDKGRINKAASDALIKRFASDEDPDLVMLSRDEGGKSPFDDLLNIIDATFAPGIPSGSQTGVQMLSRETPLAPGEPVPEPKTDQKKLDALLALTPAGQAALAARTAK